MINSIYNFVPYTIKCVLASVYGFYLDNIRYDSNLIKRVEKYIKNENFFFTYGDGVGKIDIDKLLKFHLKHKSFRELFSMQRSMCHTTENIGKQKMNLLPY